MSDCIRLVYMHVLIYPCHILEAILANPSWWIGSWAYKRTLFISSKYSCIINVNLYQLFINVLVMTDRTSSQHTVYPKKYAHGFCFAVLCCVYTLTDFPISIRLTSLALWQSNDCPSASKATLMNMDKYFMWIHNQRMHNHNKAKHNKTVCIFLGIYCNEPEQNNHHFCIHFIEV